MPYIHSVENVHINNQYHRTQTLTELSFLKLSFIQFSKKGSKPFLDILTIIVFNFVVYGFFIGVSVGEKFKINIFVSHVFFVSKYSKPDFWVSSKSLKQILVKNKMSIMKI